MALWQSSSCPGKSAKRVFAPDVPGIHVLTTSGKKGVDGRDKPGHDGEKRLAGEWEQSAQLFFSPDMIGPNNSQFSPLKRIICSCSSGAKSVGLVLILVPGR